ncbi:hypothetical protein ACWDNT_21590 [Streptomyces sp. NPDC000963]|uniref:hypothetical protein n=1 Tax=Streptomyces sp. NPDC007872 TaxID=3364782 RepID=UPI00368C971A
MPQLPEDIIDRLNRMERRIKALSTAVNTRPPLNEIVNGQLTVKRTRADESTVPVVQMVAGSPMSSSKQVIQVFDGYEHELFADDANTGGLARPWLAMMPPVDQNYLRWPSTTSTTFTTIARSFNPVWQPWMRLLMYTRAIGGAGQIKVLVDGVQFGPVVAGNTNFEHIGPVTSDLQNKFGKVVSFEVQAMAATGATVYAQPVLMFGTNSVKSPGA